MGRRGRRKATFLRKNRITLIGGGIVTVLVLALLGTVLSFSNPYRGILRAAGVSVKECSLKKDVLTLTFEGDALGILSCRDALNALRAKKAPQTVEWILIKNGETLLSGTVNQVDTRSGSTTSRVETLNEDLTLLKLKYELTKNGYAAELRSQPTVGLTGKTVTVTVNVPREEMASVRMLIPAVVDEVNAQGGGIVRCDVLFTEPAGIFAAASYDFVYGDTLLSSALQEE